MNLEEAAVQGFIPVQVVMESTDPILGYRANPHDHLLSELQICSCASKWKSASVSFQLFCPELWIPPNVNNKGKTLVVL